MSNKTTKPRPSSIKQRLRTVLRGVDDTRLRATWRVALALPMFIVVQILAGRLRMALGMADQPKMVGLTVTYVIMAVLFVVAFAGWARYVDRRSISDYGFAPSGRWFADSLAGFAAVVVGTGIWHALGAALGWTTLEPTLAYSEGSLALWLGVLLVAIYLSAWVQDVVYFGIILRNAAEGLRTRGLSATRALAAAVVVATLVFVGFHFAMGAGMAERLSPPAAVLSLGASAVLLGLLYVQTGELALPIGVHAGANYVFGMIFVEMQFPAPTPEVIRVGESLPGSLSVLGAAQVPEVLFTYLLALAWIKWRRGDASIEAALARWTGSEHSPV